MNIVMPKLGLTMTEATLTRWHKTEGQEARQGEILFEFESEKSVMEYECPADGRLVRHLVAEGETVPCGAPVAVFEPVSVRAGQQPEQPQAGPPAASPTRPAETASPGPASSAGYVVATPAARRRARELNLDLSALNGRGPEGRIQLADVEEAARASASPPVSPVATPVARRVAADLGVDLARLSGSGPGGRVVKEDVLLAHPPGPVEAARTLPLSGVRGVIARRMSESAFTAPHVTLFTEADASDLVAARAQINAELAGKLKISYNALFIAIVARLLPEHPDLNAFITAQAIQYYQEVNIALAVDTDRGLLTPVIRNADRLDLVSIQQTGDRLIERAVAGRSLPDDLAGGTFTITNLGMYDIDGFTPIINQPQAAILGVGRIQPRPAAVDGRLEIRHMLTLSLSFDHRIVDGAPAARFLQRVKQLIERPFALAVPARSL